MALSPIPFIDLAAQQRAMGERIKTAIMAVLDHSGYIMGAEVSQLEDELAAGTGVKHVLSCSSGTDALIMALMALGLKKNQGVIVPSFTFTSSAEVVLFVGATPIFADIDPITFNLDPKGLANALIAAEQAGIDCRGIISVGLFGQPADFDAIDSFAKQHGLWVLDDAAQSYGASWQGKPVGTLGQVSATSFFPAKPLGCYGDGGAIFTDDDDCAEVMRSIRIHGIGKNGSDYERVGMTARLDTIQAAILLEKLKIFDEELMMRQQVADRYHAALGEIVETPQLVLGATSSWAQYTIKLPHKLPRGIDRQAVQDHLKQQGIPTAIYYKKGIHEHAPYHHCPVAQGGLPATKACCERVLSLPIHPYLDEETQSRITGEVIAAIGE